LAERRSSLTTDADDALAIRTVGRELNVKNDVVHANGILNALAQRMFLMQDHDSVEFRTRIVRFGQPQLLSGAKHACAFHAAHVRGLDGDPANKFRAIHCHWHKRAFKHVCCTRHNAKGGFSAYVDGADLQLVRVGVLFKRIDAPHHNTGYTGHFF